MEPETTSPVPQAPPAPTPAPSPLKQIRTFQGDIAEALHREKASVYSIQQAEVKRTEARHILAPALKAESDLRVEREREAVRHHEEIVGREKILLLILGILVLLGAGGAGMWYAYGLYQDKTALPVIASIPNRFIPVESTLTLDAGTLTRDLLLQNINAEENKNVSGLEQIQLRLGSSDTSPLLSAGSFITLIGARAPASLVRSFDPLFMLGIIGGTPTHTFLIVKLDSFENAYPGMLAWEQDLPQDLLPLITPSSGGGVDTPATMWRDAVIQNKDARVLKDVNGDTRLLYTFLKNDLLIITDNESGLRSLIDSLTTASLSR